LIIDDTHKTAFVHVPKCGGTTISVQFGELDSYGGDFRVKGVHPVLGAIHYAHIPLRFLARCYPEQFGKVRTYQSFALSRDPHDRFASATFQRLAEFRGVAKIDVTLQRALSEARSVMDWLTLRGPFCDLEYIHFSRQADYVSLDGERIVDDVFALEDISDLTAELGRRCHIHFDPERRENTNFASKSRLLSVLHVAKPIYSRLTPWAFRERLLYWGKRWNILSPQSLYDDFRRDPRINDFVETYYAEDLALHRSALAGLRRPPRADVVTAPSEIPVKSA
jgi:hypothetical protein